MSDKRIVIDDNRMITIKNNTGGGIAYRTDMGILRRWERPNTSKKVNFLELQQTISKIGVYNMFSRGLLLIDEVDANQIMDELGIPELDEYICTLDEIDELLNGVDYEDLINVLKWGSKSQTETIVSVAVGRKIDDANVVKIIKDTTAVDITAIDPIDKKEKVDDKKPTRKKANVEEVKPKRQVKKATPAKKEEDVKAEKTETKKAK